MQNCSLPAQGIRAEKNNTSKFSDRWVRCNGPFLKTSLISAIVYPNCSSSPGFPFHGSERDFSISPFQDGSCSHRDQTEGPFPFTEATSLRPLQGLLAPTSWGPPPSPRRADRSSPPGSWPNGTTAFQPVRTTGNPCLLFCLQFAYLELLLTQAGFASEWPYCREELLQVSACWLPM